MDRSLPIMETFYSIQGEGFYSGYAAYFIRLGGCDVGCHWCDVKESWPAKDHAPQSVQEIVGIIPKHTKRVIITGGEPLMWDMTLLTKTLNNLGIRTHLETSGAHALTGVWDWICLSPKKPALPQKEIYEHAHELKIVVHNKHDFIFAESQAKLVGKNCLLYLQPEWENREKMEPLVVEYVKGHPHWQLSLQTHKYLGIR